MGHFFVDCVITHIRNPKKTVKVAHLLVDTGSEYSWIREETLKGIGAGDSIAVDGICLTVTRHDSASFFTFASAETLRCTKKETLRLDELEDDKVLEVVAQTTTRLPLLDDQVPVLFLSDGRPYMG